MLPGPVPADHGNAMRRSATGRCSSVRACTPTLAHLPWQILRWRIWALSNACTTLPTCFMRVKTWQPLPHKQHSPALHCLQRPQDWAEKQADHLSQRCCQHTIALTPGQAMVFHPVSCNRQLHGFAGVHASRLATTNQEASLQRGCLSFITDSGSAVACTQKDFFNHHMLTLAGLLLMLKVQV